MGRVLHDGIFENDLFETKLIPQLDDKSLARCSLPKFKAIFLLAKKEQNFFVKLRDV